MTSRDDLAGAPRLARRRTRLLAATLVALAALSASLAAFAPHAMHRYRVRVLLAKMASPDADVRAEAVSVGEIELLAASADLFRGLLGLLDDPDENVRIGAGRRTADIVANRDGGGPPHEVSEDEIARAVCAACTKEAGFGGGNVFHGVVLGALDVDSVPALGAAYDGADEEGRELVLAAATNVLFGRIRRDRDASAARSLVRRIAADDPDERLRARALRSSVAIATPDLSAEYLLDRFARDPSPIVRTAAAQELGVRGRREAVPAIVRALLGDDRAAPPLVGDAREIVLAVLADLLAVDDVRDDEAELRAILAREDAAAREPGR